MRWCSGAWKVTLGRTGQASHRLCGLHHLRLKLLRTGDEHPTPMVLLDCGTFTLPHTERTAATLSIGWVAEQIFDWCKIGGGRELRLRLCSPLLKLGDTHHPIVASVYWKRLYPLKNINVFLGPVHTHRAAKKIHKANVYTFPSLFGCSQRKRKRQWKKEVATTICEVIKR